MANKLIFILHHAYCESPRSDFHACEVNSSNGNYHKQAEGLKPIFFQAAVAAAMQYETEIVLSGVNTELARPGVAAEMFLPGEEGKTVHDYMQEAVEAGACIKVCSAPADLPPDSMIPRIQERVGSTYLISELMDQDTVTLTY